MEICHHIFSDFYKIHLVNSYFYFPGEEAEDSYPSWLEALGWSGIALEINNIDNSNLFVLSAHARIKIYARRHKK